MRLAPSMFGKEQSQSKANHHCVCHELHCEPTEHVADVTYPLAYGKSKWGIAMVIPRLKICSVRLGGSAALAVVVTVALVAAPSEHRTLPNEIHQVQLTAMILGAVGDTAASESAAPEAVVGSAPEPAAFESGAQSAVSAASATEDNFFDTPLGTVLALANLVALPLWFLFTPITLPLSMLAGASTVTMDGPFGTLQFLIATGLAFIGGPLGLLSIFLNSSASAAAAELPGAGRSVSASEVPAQAAATSSPAVAAVEDDLVALPVRTERNSAVERTRGRLLERTVGTSTRAAAAMTTTEPTAVDSSVESLSSDMFAKQPTSSAGEVEQAESSMPEGSSAKSRAPKSGSRR